MEGKERQIHWAEVTGRMTPQIEGKITFEIWEIRTLWVLYFMEFVHFVVDFSHCILL